MTEQDAINGVNADAAEAQALTAEVTGAFATFDAADAELAKAVDAVGAALAQLESNVRYAKDRYL